MYGPNAAAKARFMANQVATASPAMLLTMLYDRLVLDIARGEAALREGDRPGAHEHLVHAQDIITELLSTLDTEAWEGGPQLAQLYSFFLTELIGANVSGDADRAVKVRELIEPLRQAWHAAALEVTSTPAGAGIG